MLGLFAFGVRLNRPSLTDKPLQEQEWVTCAFYDHTHLARTVSCADQATSA